MTPTSTVPAKTQLGLDELRHRTRRLSQRHRTVLLLVDGQRPLSAVLSLAQQAGAATSHFEELVTLGLVEVPLPEAEPEAAAAVPDEDEAPTVVSVELPVVDAQVIDNVDEVGVAAAAPVRIEATGPAPLEDPWERTVRLEGPVAAPEPEPVSEPEPAAVAATPKPVVVAAVVPPPEPPVLHAAVEPEPRRRRARRAKLPVLDEVDESAMLQQVRDLLVDTLRFDAPLFGARTLVRVRAAQTAGELIELVWEIEQHLKRARHSRRELLALQRARELLGLGNTLVADDNDPGITEY